MQFSLGIDGLASALLVRRLDEAPWKSIMSDSVRFGPHSKGSVRKSSGGLEGWGGVGCGGWDGLLFCVVLELESSKTLLLIWLRLKH